MPNREVAMKKCVIYLFTLVAVLTVIIFQDGMAANIEYGQGFSTLEAGTKLTRDFSFGLSDNLEAAPYDNTKDNFFAFKNELPQELPVYAPYTDEEISKSKNKLYIAVNGDDRNDGSIDKPVKTLQRACEIAKGINAKNGGLTIYFREGTYSQESGFNIPPSLNGSEENPTFIAAYPGERVTLSTAIFVKGSDMRIADDDVSKRKLHKKAKNKVYSVDLKKLGYDNYGRFSTTKRPNLLVDGVEYTIARWPNAGNTGMIKYTGTDGENGVIESGDILIAGQRLGEYTGDTGTGFEFLPSSSIPFGWENTGNIWMYGYWFEEWAKYHIQVKEFNEAKSSVSTVQNCQYGAMYLPEKSYYFYNILEELDIPGEWYIDDKTGMLYLYPLSELKNSEIFVTTTSSDVLALSNTQNVVISGFDINVSGGYGVNLSGSRSIVQKCNVKSCSSGAVKLNGINCGLLSNKLLGNVWMITPGDNIAFTEYKPTRNFAQNNIVQGTLQDNYGYQSVVSHNLITGSNTHALFSYRCIESIYEYNEFVGGPNVNIDAGVIYTGGGLVARNNHFRYNFLNRATDTIRKNPRGVYIDDMASYAFVYGNIMLEANCFIHGGSECVFYNNLIVDNNSSTGSFTNSDNYQITKPRWGGMIISDSDTRWFGQERSVYFQDWITRYIYDYQYHTSFMKHKHEYDSAGYTTDNDDYGKWVASPKYNYYANNLLVNSNDYQVAQTERDSVYENNISINYDPGFKDYQNGDYSLDKKSIKAVNPLMEAIPSQHKMGLLYDERFSMQKNDIDKPHLSYPINSLDEVVLDNENVILKWADVFGKSVYIVDVARDANFNDIVFTQRTQVNSTVVPKLEYSETYYWRVSAQSWTDAFNKSLKVSDIYAFRIGTLDEIAANASLDFIGLNHAIDDLSSMYEIIAKDYENDVSGDIYVGNVVKELAELLEEARNISDNANIRIQKDVDNYANDLYKRFYSVWGKYVKSLKYDIVGELGNEDDWMVVGKGNIKKTDEGFELSGDQMPMIMSANSVGLIRPNTEYNIRIKYDKLASWTTMQLFQTDNKSTGPTYATDYFIVFKPDVIELQRYPKDLNAANGILQTVENNSEIVRDDKWFDLSYTMKYTVDGPQIIASVDGKEIINYVDKSAKNNNYNYFGLMINSGNGVTSISRQMH